jgi:hypothetical protein
MGVLRVRTSVAATVVTGMAVVTVGFACCAVHPLNATSTITKMNKPIYVFMK